METSAKNASNVEQAFMAMTAAIKNRYGKTLLNPLLFFTNHRFTSSIIDFETSLSWWRSNSSVIEGHSILCVSSQLKVLTDSWTVHLLFIYMMLNTNIGFYRMASQPASGNGRPPTVQIRGQPVNQKSGCCSGWKKETAFVIIQILDHILYKNIAKIGK